MSMESLVRSFYDDLWNAWDDTLVSAVLSETFEFRGSLGTTSIGRRGWLDYRDVVRSGSADFHNELVTLVCEGDRAAARLLYSGTHTGHSPGRAGHRTPLRVRRRGVLHGRARAAGKRVGARRPRRDSAVSSADRPLGDGEVDDPARSLGEVVTQLAGAEQRAADALGEGLRAGGQPDGVGADHPGAVCRDVATSGRGDAEDEAPAIAEAKTSRSTNSRSPVPGFGL